MPVAVVPSPALDEEASRCVLRDAPGQPVHGAIRIGAALAGLIRSARHELLSFDDPAVALDRGVPEPLLRSVGASVRAAARTAAVRWIAPRRGLAHVAGTGEPWHCPDDTRVTESIPFQILVADRSVAAVPLDLDLYHHGTLLIRDPVLIQALVRTHRAWWETGDELAPHTVRGTAPGHLRPVLQALMAGLTDEAAATRLGMSARTYSRRVGELLAALGTTSRFRAGAEAARRGWI